jgi:hypothetical protein
LDSKGIIQQRLQYADYEEATGLLYPSLFSSLPESAFITSDLDDAMATSTLNLSICIRVTLLFTLAYIAYVLVHRLYFSPLAGFPGPKLAAATHWYEFYYDYWCNGKYIFEIEKMHKKYGGSSTDYYTVLPTLHRALTIWEGPIIRINPEELCIHDPGFYNEIYCTESKRKTETYDVFCKGIDFDGTNLRDRYPLTCQSNIVRVALPHSRS